MHTFATRSVDKCCAKSTT